MVHGLVRAHRSMTSIQLARAAQMTGNKPLTSAAAAAAAFGSFSMLLSPSDRGGPPTVLFGATLLGIVALVACAGASPTVLP
jgi:hypothetical protein